jgi:hypothetical protein
MTGWETTNALIITGLWLSEWGADSLERLSASISLFAGKP